MQAPIMEAPIMQAPDIIKNVKRKKNELNNAAPNNYKPKNVKKVKTEIVDSKKDKPKKEKVKKETKEKFKKETKEKVKKENVKKENKEKVKKENVKKEKVKKEKVNEESVNEESVNKEKVKKEKVKKEKVKKEKKKDIKTETHTQDGKNKNKVKSIADRYQKMTLLESILKRPDTYVGSLVKETESLYVPDLITNRMVLKKVSFVPGLWKIFDEIIVNAADHRQRDSTMTTLKVTIDKPSGKISVFNDGAGVPVVIHETYKIYVPELIFGELLTGENYNDNDERVVGGRNGYGAKLANIFSTEFIVETNDIVSGHYFKQVFTNNMKTKSAPEVKPAKGAKGWTKITFTPDFSKFSMDSLDDDTILLFSKRVYDMAGTCSTLKPLKVSLNGEPIKIKGFEEYCKMFLPETDAAAYVHSKTDRWEIIVASSPTGTFQQVSYVNAISTITGGQHVNAVTEQLTKALTTYCEKKHHLTTLKPQMIKNSLWVFVNCLIVNPRFDSQTKVNMTSSKSQFGSSWEMTEQFLKKLVKSTEIVTSIVDQANYKSQQGLKKTDGKKKGGRLSGIAKLEDANDAGGKHAADCTLILTEGDSAKALAMSGLTVVGRNRFGVFPLRGKLLNVRDAKISQVTANAEITNIKQILGLKTGEVYIDTKGLRYGHLMIMADQDHDGSHIKGLVINLFAHFWPSLLKLPGFLTEFITPIVKVSKGKQNFSFFTIPEYERWKETTETQGWKIKYYKGLGTSTPQEAKEYFSDIDRHKIDFKYEDSNDEKLFNMAFSKKLADQRKQWIGQFIPGTFLDQDVSHVTYSNFVNKELILFSIESNVRAIPSMVDGLKPGQRKIIYSCFKRNLTKEIKVAQLAGYVSEHSSYHHAEASLSGTIVGLAQNFVGNNNLNLLYPAGQFGTRSEGGKDAASARYIFTHLCPITRILFVPEDDNLLHYLDDDGQSIEPEWYIPVVPAVLINGADGIGTGYSTKIPNYNPRDVVLNLKRMSKGEEPEPMHPWFKGFKGSIESVENNKTSYIVKGLAHKENDHTIRITELPVKVWTTSYRTDVLEKLIKDGVIVSFKEHHTDTSLDFEIKVLPENMSKIEAKGLCKTFNLISSLSTGNMVLFDEQCKLKKYSGPLAILKEFYPLRLKYYEKRKFWMQCKLDSELNRISNKLRFILAVIGDELKIRNVKKDIIIQELINQKYDALPKVCGHSKIKAVMSVENDDDTSEENKENKENKEHQPNDKKSYDYLLSMPLWSLTMERVAALQKEEAEKKLNLGKLMATSEQQMWLTDLDNFLFALNAHEERERLELELDKKIVKKKDLVLIKGKKHPKPKKEKQVK